MSSFKEERSFEIDYMGRMFEGACEVTWGWEPAQNGGRTDPSWDAYAYVEDIKILKMGWHGLNDGHYFDVSIGDRNWLRLNKLLADLEGKIEFEEPEATDSYEPDYEPTERETTDREIDKAQTDYERSIGL